MARKHKYSGWGLSDRLKNPPGLLLFNFDVGSAHLKIEHRDELKQTILPRIKMRHGVTVVGLASRTGPEASNVPLSYLRAENTLTCLESMWRDFKRKPAVAFGSAKAKQEGDRKGFENPRFRSVVVYVGPSEDPPFTPGVIDVSPDIPDFMLPEEKTHSLSLGEWNDTINGISQMLELVPWEKVAELAEKADLATTIIAGLINMPMLWKETKEQNEQNGKLQGYWECLQDLADQYKDPKLSEMPLEEWPELRRVNPRPMPPRSGAGVNEKEWMDGKREACELLNEAMEFMDRKPKVKNNWEITGRRWLFLLSQKFGRGVAEAALADVNEKLRKKKYPPWPIMK